MSDRALFLHRGDIGVTESNSFLGKRIKRLTQTPGEEPTEVNHAFIVVRPGTLWTAEIVEALGQGVVRQNLADGYAGCCDRVRIWHNPSLDDQQRLSITAAAERMIGMKYGWIELLAHAGDALVSKLRRKEVVLFRKLCRIKKTTICSVVVAKAFVDATGMAFGVPVQATQPDHIDDWCKYHKPWVMTRDLARVPRL